MAVDAERAHWWWRDAPCRTPARAVVVDVDGVLADAQGRQHHLSWDRRDWDAFFDACGEDPVVDEVRTLLSLLDPALVVLLVTARPSGCATSRWPGSASTRLRWDLLVMRPSREYAPADAFKRDVVDELRGEGFVLELALEDDPRNRDMYLAAGVPCLYLHSGVLRLIDEPRAHGARRGAAARDARGDPDAPVGRAGHRDATERAGRRLDPVDAHEVVDAVLRERRPPSASPCDAVGRAASPKSASSSSPTRATSVVVVELVGAPVVDAPDRGAQRAARRRARGAATCGRGT